MQYSHSQPLSQAKLNKTVKGGETKFIQNNNTVSNKVTKDIQSKENKAIGVVNLYTQCYNQIDAIFTELEDYLCQAKDQILGGIRSLLKSNQNQLCEKVKQKVEEMITMSDYVKNIVHFFIIGEPLRQTSSTFVNHSIPISNTTHANVLTPSNNTNNLKSKNSVSFQKEKKDGGKRVSTFFENSKQKQRGSSSKKKTVYEKILQQKQNKCILKANNGKI